MNVQDIFLNQTGRLRSGWRFTIFLFTFIFTATYSLRTIIDILSSLPIGFSEKSIASSLVESSVLFFFAVFFGWLYGKIFEDLPFRALGCWLTKRWLKDLVLGLVWGAVSFSFAALFAFVFGGLSFHFNQNHGTSAILLTLGTSLMIFIAGAAFEEVFFRGYILQTLSRAKLAWVAIAITSLFFAAAHLNNNNANFFSTINTALAGIWLGIAYLKTRNLWFPFGVHLTWNWFQGAIFGVEVSGKTKFTTAPFLREIDLGPAWLTGENYGIEGGIACTIALILSTALIYFLPIFKPSDEMIALTSEEKSLTDNIGDLDA